MFKAFKTHSESQKGIGTKNEGKSKEMEDITNN